MLFTRLIAIACLGAALAGCETAATAQSSRSTSQAMTEAQMRALLDDGQVLRLGGPGEGYSGTLRLNPDGTGRGEARTDAGQTVVMNGTWEIEDGRFCRTWANVDDGARVCETWVPTAPTSVAVYRDGQKIGVNSW